MNETQTRFKKIAGALAMTALLVLPAKAAGDQDWILRTGLAGLNSTGNLTTSSARVAYQTDLGVGLSVALEHRLKPRIGVEFSGIFAGLGSDLSMGLPGNFNVSQGLSSGTLQSGVNLYLRDYVPLSAGVNLHLTPDKAANVYLGPMLTYSIIGEIGIVASANNVRTGARRDSNLGLGIQAGIDVPFGQRSSGFHGSLKYLDVTHQVTNGTKANLNPVIVTVGISFRF